MSVKKPQEIADLLERWITGLSAEDNLSIVQEITKRGDGFFLVDIDAINTNDTSRKLRLVNSLIGLFNIQKHFELARKIAGKGMQLEAQCQELTDVHFFYMNMIKIFYKMRTDIPDALDTTIAYCKKQIDIAPKVAEEMKREFKGGLPSHTGYEQLAIIYEKQGEYDLALNLCHEAKCAGWGEGVTNPSSRPDWDKRIEKIRKKMDKDNKTKGKENRITSVNESVKNTVPELIKVPCPNCGSILQIPIKYIGVQGRCKKCGCTFVVPDKS